METFPSAHQHNTVRTLFYHLSKPRLWGHSKDISPPDGGCVLNKRPKKTILPLYSFGKHFFSFCRDKSFFPMFRFFYGTHFQKPPFFLLHALNVFSRTTRCSSFFRLPFVWHRFLFPLVMAVSSLRGGFQLFLSILIDIRIKSAE